MLPGKAMDDQAIVEALGHMREICLALPEAEEKPSDHPHATFVVRNKTFAMFLDNHHGDGRVALWCKAPAGLQSALVEKDPERFFVPPYVGVHGWVGMTLDPPMDWDEATDLIVDAYRLTAPKRLIAKLVSA